MIDVSCHVGEAVQSGFAKIVSSICEGAVSLIAKALTWWTQADQSSLLTSPGIGQVRTLFMPVVALILMLSIIWQGIQVMVQRKANPMINIGVGLWAYAGWTTLGATVAVSIYQAGVELAHTVLGNSIDEFSKKLGQVLSDQVTTGNANSTAGTLGIAFFMGLVFLGLATAQWIFGIARLAGVAVLLALIPVAASGQLTDSTRPWMKKIASWSLALLLYQPVAAAIYVVGFGFVSKAQDITALLGGACTMALSIVALPAMMKFFDWGGQRFTTAGGGGGGMGAMAAAGTAGMGMMQFMSANGPGSGGGGSSSSSMRIAPANNGTDPLRPGASNTSPDGPGSNQQDTGASQPKPQMAMAGAPQGGQGGGTGPQQAAQPVGSSGGPAAAAGGGGAAGPIAAAASGAVQTTKSAVNTTAQQMTQGPGDPGSGQQGS
ncbi:hypothetical protein [Amycolatopsis sp. NPDC051903]|uniref:hypothetical protein n=1 Tax=Amycolatopsis sp. NPDC051903 TaxID=3363936 RepID=UPI0037B0C265